MEISRFSPYIRRAEHSVLTHPFLINTRVIYDYEIIYVADGQCTVTIKDTAYTVKKGDAVLIPPGVSHKLESNGFDFVQPHMHFDVIYNENSAATPISFKDVHDMTELEKKLIQENIFSEFDIPFIFKPCEPERFKKLLYDAIRFFSEGMHICVMARTLELISMILNQFDVGTRTDTTDTSETVKSYIDSNFMQNISLDGLSLQFHINKFTLIRNFGKQYGCGVMEYYRSKRIEYAKKTLSETNLSVSDIGEQLCFNDIYSFSRFFKNCVGVSPSEYRKTNKI